MEHYHKATSQFTSDAKLSNELEISSSGKPYDLATRALHMLRHNPGVGVVISSCGNYVTKAVTVAELIKRRHPDVTQDTQLKYSRVQDVWEPDDEELDILTVVRRIPAIVIKFTEEDDSGVSEDRKNEPVVVKAVMETISETDPEATKSIKRRDTPSRGGLREKGRGRRRGTGGENEQSRKKEHT